MGLSQPLFSFFCLLSNDFSNTALKRPFHDCAVLREGQYNGGFAKKDHSPHPRVENIDTLSFSRIFGQSVFHAGTAKKAI
jgi:hypothetical protein